MKKRFIIVGIILFLVFGGLVAYHFVVQAMTAKYMKNYAPPPVTVNVLEVTPVSWQPTYDAVGSMVAVQGTNISPVVSGMVTKILFNSGDIVKKNQILAVLDTGVLSAQLNDAEALMVYNKKTYDRYQTLYRQGAMSASQVDLASATYQQSAAQVAQDSAYLQQKYITAPFAGRVGIRSASLGQYLNAGDVITNIQQLNPMYLNFELPEQFLQSMYLGQPVEVSVDTFPGLSFKGKITAFDAEVGNDTKSITVQATLDNSNSKSLLLPGMQADITVFLKGQGKVIAVPQQAIDYSLYGNTVYVITEGTNKTGQAEKIATQVAVTPGAQQGNLVEITGGLKEGDLIVVDGLPKLQNNSPVTIVNETAQS